MSQSGESTRSFTLKRCDLLLSNPRGGVGQGSTVNDGFLQAKGPRDGRRHADFLKGFFIRLLHRDGPDVSAYGEGFERKSGTLRIPGRFCRVGGRVGFHV